jgi:transposase
VSGVLLRNAKVKAERTESMMKTVFELEVKSQDEAFKTPEAAEAWLADSAPVYKKMLKPELSGATWVLKRKPNVLAAWAETFGQQIILSSKSMPIKSIAEVYRTRGDIEQIFDTPKNDLHQKRNRSGNDDVVDGHLFLSFLAVILRRLLADKLAQSSDTKTLPLTRVQNLVRRIQVHVSPNGKTFPYDITKPQRLILQAVGVEIGQ